MKRTLAVAALALGVAALACNEVSAPARANRYEWRLFAANPQGGTDTLSFHWPAGQVVRVWAEDSLDLATHVQNGIAAWEDALLYNELQAELVTDSSSADIIVRAGFPPKQFDRMRLGSYFAPECSGATDLDVSDDHTELTLPIHSYIAPKGLELTPAAIECIDLTTTHELGHAFGIMQHAPDPADLMYGDPVVTAPSEADRETLEAVYHFPPTMTLVRH